MASTDQYKSLPKPRFKNLAYMNRYKALCLWCPVSIIRRTLPWGYKVDPSNPKVAIPDDKALACYIKAHEYLKGNSYQTVSDWLTSCGFPIGDWGLMKMLSDRPYWPEIDLPMEERMKL